MTSNKSSVWKCPIENDDCKLFPIETMCPNDLSGALTEFVNLLMSLVHYFNWNLTYT